MILKSYEIIKKTTKFIKYNFFLLYGENIGLKKDIKESIKIAINKNNNSIEYFTLQENDVCENENNFYNTIFSGSLFSNTKFITINNATDKIIKQIKSVSEKHHENVFVVINANILDKKSKLRNFFEKSSKTICIPCYLDNAKDLEIIAINEIRKNNINLSHESINLLIEKSNNDRNNLRNEMEKIKSFALNKKTINTEEIKSLINFSGNHKSENFINECLCGNISQYKKILSDFYNSTTNQIFLLRILSNKMYRLLNMKEEQRNHNNIDKLLDESKPPIFWKEKPLIKKQLTIWTSKNLKTTIGEINETELLCKKNSQISKIIFFNFFTKVCIRANNYS